MDANVFRNKLARAQQLMLSEDFNNAVEAKAGAFSGTHRGGARGGSSSDLKLYEKMAFGYTPDDDNPRNIQMLNGGQAGQVQPITPQGINPQAFSKLPKAIQESLLQTPPMSGDGIDASPLGAITNSMMGAQMQAPRMSQPISMGGSSVDYGLIKTIIENCINEKMSMLNESRGNSFAGMRIADGNRIQFLDSKGNLYEGVLKLKKKATK